MKYAALLKNDIVDGDDGICVSLWMQGCPHHCKNCHNPETWDFNGGLEIETKDLVKQIIASISENGIIRNFSVLGGEPLAPQNIENTYYILKEVRKEYPNIKIFIWSGYLYEDLKKNKTAKKIFKLADILIDGPYIESLRDLTLKLRGSSNQRIINLRKV